MNMASLTLIAKNAFTAEHASGTAQYHGSLDRDWVTFPSAQAQEACTRLKTKAVKGRVIRPLTATVITPRMSSGVEKQL